MITGNIKDAKRYFGINPNFEKAFEFLQTLSVDSATGPFESDEFKGNISVIKTSDCTPNGEPKKLEAHREYIDIHYCIDGFETIGYADIDSLIQNAEYNVEQDYLLLNGDMSKLVLGKGEFCIVFPEDAHAPGMCVGSARNVKKAVVKIKDKFAQ